MDRSAPGPGDELEYCVFLARRHGFDAAVAAVAHPTGDAELSCLFGHRRAVADALDDTFDDEMTCDMRHMDLRSGSLGMFQA